jgi:hypothetical protein
MQNNEYIGNGIFGLFGIADDCTEKLVNPYADVVTAFAAGRFGVEPSVVFDAKSAKSSFPMEWA